MKVSVGIGAVNICKLTAEARWIQSSHQNLLPPSQREVKRIATAITGITPVTYAVIRIMLVYESCGLLQSVACTRSVAARPLVTVHCDAVMDVRTECLIESTFLEQARLQNLGGVLGIALALEIEETAPDKG